MNKRFNEQIKRGIGQLKKLTSKHGQSEVNEYRQREMLTEFTQENIENDTLLSDIFHTNETTSLRRSLDALWEYKLIIVVAICIASVWAFNKDSIRNFWLYISLENFYQEEVTLATKPIHVINQSLIAYANAFNNLDISKATPLILDAVTRYRTDKLRYKSEFLVNSTISLYSKCSVVSEGELSNVKGGIEHDTYSVVLSCPNRSPKLLDNAAIVAFKEPESINNLSSVTYFLILESSKYLSSSSNDQVVEK